MVDVIWDLVAPGSALLAGDTVSSNRLCWTVSDGRGSSRDDRRARGAFWIALIGGSVTTAVLLQTSRPASAVALLVGTYCVAVAGAISLFSRAPRDATRRRRLALVLTVALITGPIVVAAVRPLRQPMIYDVLGFSRTPTSVISVLESDRYFRLKFVVANTSANPQTMTAMRLNLVMRNQCAAEGRTYRYRVQDRVRLFGRRQSGTRDAQTRVKSDEDPGFFSTARGTLTSSCTRGVLRLRFSTSLPIPGGSTVRVSLDVPHDIELVSRGPWGGVRRRELYFGSSGRESAVDVTLQPSGTQVRSCLEPCDR